MSGDATEQLVTLRTYPTLAEAKLDQAWLEKAGLPSSVSGEELESVSTIFPAGSIELRVSPALAKKARAFLSARRSESNEESSWTADLRSSVYPPALERGSRALLTERVKAGYGVLVWGGVLPVIVCLLLLLLGAPPEFVLLGGPAAWVLFFLVRAELRKR